ncbi:MAG: RDD family protein [Bacteriovoracaceae bacterium]|nr:RDD family protein [Bacteriovoracaceae bacterium]
MNWSPKDEETNSQVLQFPGSVNGQKNQTELRTERWEKAAHGKLKKRFYAFFTDVFIIGLLQKTLVYSYVTFINETFHQAPLSVRKNLINNIIDLRISTLLFTFFSYFLISYYMGHGKTIGKTLFNLRVLSHEGRAEELSFMEAFMRTMGYTTCYVTGSFLFALVFFRSDNRGIPDFFSQTEVITEEEFLLYQEELSEQIEGPREDLQLDLFAS